MAEDFYHRNVEFASNQMSEDASSVVIDNYVEVVEVNSIEEQTHIVVQVHLDYSLAENLGRGEVECETGDNSDGIKIKSLLQGLVDVAVADLESGCEVAVDEDISAVESVLENYSYDAMVIQMYHLGGIDELASA